MRNRINLEQSSTETKRMWMHNVTEIMKKVKKLPRGDIRRYFEMQMFDKTIEIGC